MNLDIMDKMVIFMALYPVKNFKPWNSHLCLFIGHLGFVIRNVLVVDLMSRLDSIWQHRFVNSFKQLVTKNSD